MFFAWEGHSASSSSRRSYDVFLENFQRLPFSFSSVRTEDFAVAIDEAHWVVDIPEKPLFYAVRMNVPRPVLTQLVTAITGNNRIIVSGTSTKMAEASEYLASGKREVRSFMDFKVYNDPNEMWDMYVGRILPGDAKDAFFSTVGSRLGGRARFLQLFCEGCLHSQLFYFLVQPQTLWERRPHDETS